MEMSPDLRAGAAVQEQARSNKTVMRILIGGKARLHGKTIGKLADVIVSEHGKLPEVTHLLIDRPFGYKSLMIPWEKVELLSAKRTAVLAIDAPEPFEGEPQEGQLRLRYHLLDKKGAGLRRRRGRNRR
jgi:hypothetical protein